MNATFRNFDLEAALKGTYQVETVSGEIVKNFRENNSCKVYPYSGFINDSLFTWTKEGIFTLMRPDNTENDLVTTKKLF